MNNVTAGLTDFASQIMKEHVSTPKWQGFDVKHPAKLLCVLAGLTCFFLLYLNSIYLCRTKRESMNWFLYIWHSLSPFLGLRFEFSKIRKCNVWVFFRSPATHKMSPWVRTVFLDFMPRVLCMKRPTYHPKYTHEAERRSFRASATVGDSGYSMGFGNGYGFLLQFMQQ